MPEEKLTLAEHFRELRRVLIISIAAVLVAFFVTFTLWGDAILNFLAQPLYALGLELYYTAVSEAFTTKMKACIVVALALASPIVVWQIWRFIKPALYPREKRLFRLLFCVAVLLYAIGVVFAYLIVFQLAINFFIIDVGANATPIISMSQYVGFLISFILPFGLMFELPLVVLMLSKLGIVDQKMLKKARKYVIFLIFVAAAILTPPDVVSQILLALPMILLYEAGVCIARISGKSKERAAAEEAAG